MFKERQSEARDSREPRRELFVCVCVLAIDNVLITGSRRNNRPDSHTGREVEP